MRDVRVAAVCMRSSPGDVEGNLARMRTFALKASDRQADMVCFPELSASGYVLDPPGGPHAVALSREIADRIEALAREAGSVILAGMVEARPAGRPRICQIAAGPEGLLGLYRKTHLSPPERAGYAAGDEPGVFRHRDICFGVQLCYESHFPELSTLAALGGAEVLFIPHASPRGRPRQKAQSWLRHLPGRAFDNAFFVVACNQVGRASQGLSFPGVALVLDPSGGLITRYEKNEEGMILADLRAEVLSEVRGHRMRYFLPFRRPELYGGLCSPSAPSKGPTHPHGRESSG